MSACNYKAPNGKASQLYSGLSQLLGDDRAELAWLQMRTADMMRKTGDWTTGNTHLPLDENGEPTIQSSLQELGLGTFAHVQQLQKFMDSWHLAPVPGKLTEFYGSRQLAEKMREQLATKSGPLYNMLHIRYNPTTSHIEVSPKQVRTIHRQAPSTTVMEEPAGAAEIRSQLEAQRTAMLKDASKPYMQLQFNEDPEVANKIVTQPVEVEGTGEHLTRDIPYKRWEADIKKDYSILQKLLKCI